MSNVKTISVNAAKEKLDQGIAIFVDARDTGSYHESHIPGAILEKD